MACALAACCRIKFRFCLQSTEAEFQAYAAKPPMIDGAPVARIEALQAADVRDLLRRAEEGLSETFRVEARLVTVFIKNTLY